MRSVDSSSSAARRSAVSVAATQRSAADVAGPASSATWSSQAWSRPAAASGSASRHGSSTLSASRRSRKASSASAASSVSSAVAEAARAIASCWSATNCSASERSMPASTNRARAELMISRASVELRGRPPRSRRRIVQLVSEAGRHRAEGRKTLAILLDRGYATHHRRHLLHHPPMDRGLGKRQPAKVVRGDEREPALRVGLHADPERTAGEHRDGADPGRRALATDGLASAVVEHQGLRLALEKERHAGRLLTRLGDQPAALHLSRARNRDPLAQAPRR